eukprot:TRINITY_DN21974_c0_g2_i6.p2 TRINITY_DN21974_c0_g2~~TRINITY_DN21974_c0_g2_i6.p2  ORF type:complete len:122 (+),score=18.63 TRINITY_DN21974_c0_g2_i6:154-519(+)
MPAAGPEATLGDAAEAAVGVLLLTAYSSNYEPGPLCEEANRRYARRHGYSFRCDVLAYEEMLATIGPCTHCTWYKVPMIIDELTHAEVSQGELSADPKKSRTRRTSYARFMILEFLPTHTS